MEFSLKKWLLVLEYALYNWMIKKITTFLYEVQRIAFNATLM